jgi:hypothetical protein
MVVVAVPVGCTPTTELAAVRTKSDSGLFTAVLIVYDEGA